jgi:hypothetical protein
VKGVSVEAINEAAKSKPEGYLEDVMSYVVERRDGFLLFENDDYYILRDKYTVTLTRWFADLERNCIGC